MYSVRPFFAFSLVLLCVISNRDKHILPTSIPLLLFLTDLIPANLFDILWAEILSCLQVVFYGYILGTLFSYVVQSDDEIMSYRKSMLALKLYCKNRKLPLDLSMQLTEFFDFQISRNAGESDVRLVNSMLPDAILTEIASSRYHSLVMRCPIFVDLDSAFHEYIVTHLVSKGERQCSQIPSFIHFLTV